LDSPASDHTSATFELNLNPSEEFLSTHLARFIYSIVETRDRMSILPKVMKNDPFRKNPKSGNDLIDMAEKQD
jgi:hypothetical protein